MKPKTSLDFIHSFGLKKFAKIIDIGEANQFVDIINLCFEIFILNKKIKLN